MGAGESLQRAYPGEVWLLAAKERRVVPQQTSRLKQVTDNTGFSGTQSTNDRRKYKRAVARLSRFTVRIMKSIIAVMLFASVGQAAVEPIAPSAFRGSSISLDGLVTSVTSKINPPNLVSVARSPSAPTTSK
jgi:hypothetical protein